MKQDDLLKLAKQYFIFDAGECRTNLVRRIQREQGYAECFASGKHECDQFNCWWRQECLQPDSEDGSMDVINHVVSNQ